MQDAHNDYDITDFPGALLDIISVMNQPLRMGESCGQPASESWNRCCFRCWR